MMQTAKQLAETVGVSTACTTLQVPRSSFYRTRQQPRGWPPRSRPRPAPARALKEKERIEVRDTLNSARFQDQAPRQVWARLLDEGIYLCDWRTMYRILDAYKEVRERRNQLRRPSYSKPELLATAPNQLWSWDITKLKGPMKWVYYYLYVILDVFSRYVVGWMVAAQESKVLAERLIETSCQRQGIGPEQLTLHADRGSAMIAHSVAQLLSDLGVTPSHARPHVPDDNPYAEAHFKTMKYQPDFPKRFGCLADARAWARAFFPWYNQEHYHTGLALLTPALVHYGQAPERQAQRQQVLQAAYIAHPERFVRGQPKALPLPEAVWINKPKEEPTAGDGSLNSDVELSQNT